MISIQGLSKTYAGTVVALRSIDVDVKDGEFLVILGPSGAGKSTLMRCLNRLVEPTAGRIVHDGAEITGHARKLRDVRRDFGMVFQQFNLVKRLSVLTKCLARVNMEHKAFQRADTLSGGEQQRVAIARALAQQPKVILADEPVASLDPKIARQVLTYLREVARELGITVLCNLHQVDYAREFGERIVGMSQGTVVFDGPVSDLTDEVTHRIYYRDPTGPVASEDG